MNEVWQYLSSHSSELFGLAMFVVGLASPSAARRIRRMLAGDKILK